MEGKRLDLDAPLLSVRRSRAAPAPAPTPCSASAPAKSSVGFIPFLWEQTPGLPKYVSLSAVSLRQPPAAPNPPPPPLGRIFAETESNSSNCSTKDDDQAFLDEDAASVSSDRSPFMTCSTSSSSDAREASESFVMDPETRDFMMARFLPAAQAMAKGLTRQRSSRRLPAASARRHDGEIAHKEMYSSSTFDDEEEEEEDGEGSPKSCGSIPQFFLKNSTFCLLNPVEGLKARSRYSLRHRMLDQSVDENMWEAVYKYKLGEENQCRGEGRSKLTSESNRLTHWSDSQTHEGSSSFRRSAGAVTSPYRNEMHRSPSSEGKKFLGVPVREMESPKTASLDSIESDRRNYSVLTTSSCAEHEGSIHKETDEADCRRYGIADGSLSTKVDDKEQKDATLSLSLPSPPLPKSPSESWLRRTLPSVSSNKPYMRSMLGVQFQIREQLFKTSMKDSKHESNLKPSIASISLVRYAEVITRPVSPRSQM